MVDQQATRSDLLPPPAVLLLLALPFFSRGGALPAPSAWYQKQVHGPHAPYPYPDPTHTVLSTTSFYIMSPPSGLIGGFGTAKDLDTETTALLSGVKGEVEKVRRRVRVGMQCGVRCL